jgi:hypothetical protein
MIGMNQYLNIAQQYIKRIKNIMVYIKRIRKCPQKDVVNNPLFSRCCVCVIAANSYSDVRFVFAGGLMSYFTLAVFVRV